MQGSAPKTLYSPDYYRCSAYHRWFHTLLSLQVGVWAVTIIGRWHHIPLSHGTKWPILLLRNWLFRCFCFKIFNILKHLKWWEILLPIHLKQCSYVLVTSNCKRNSHQMLQWNSTAFTSTNEAKRQYDIMSFLILDSMQIWTKYL